MYRFHLTRNLRTLGFLTAFAAVIAALVGLWWANYTGLPASWRGAIEREIESKGAHVTIGTLRYVPLRGIVATDVRVFAEALHVREISRLERVSLGFDKSQLALGKFQLNKVELEDAKLDLPIDPNRPDAGVLHVTDANGIIVMPGDHRIEVRKAHGRIAGIDITLDARVIVLKDKTSPPPDESAMAKRRELVAQILHELSQWHFDEAHPPAVRVTLEGDASDHSTIAAKIAVDIKSMERNGHKLDSVSAEAEVAGDLVTISQLRATDPRGVFEGHFDYDLHARSGRFDVTSSLEVPQLLNAWAGLPMPQDAVFGGRQLLEAGGDFVLDEHNVPAVSMTGHARCESVMLRGMPFEFVEGSFSWADNKLFLRDMRFNRGDGEAKAKVMIEWPLVRMELDSTLPTHIYKPFFIRQPLEIVLNDFGERENAAIDLHIEGGFDSSNHEAWAYTGHGSVRNMTYKGVPADTAHCKFTVNHRELDFYDGSVTFNYSKYPLRKAFGGPDQGTVSVGRIRYDAADKWVEVENVSGAVWAAPLVRTFAPQIADTLEVYRFHRPPALRGSGVVDVTPAGRTNLTVSFSSDSPANYRFLDEDLTLDHPTGNVRILGSKVSVENLKLAAFDGPVNAHFDRQNNGLLSGEISWTKLSLNPLAETYGFDLKGGGTVTGRIDFKINEDKVGTMDGEGLIAIENTELFAVPMFGPITPLIGEIVNREKAGFQKARDAFATFRIQNGVLVTNDFHTSTRSLNFTGEGSIDLRDRTLDMTMRMNARGLLSLITLPLRPFAGLFQFRGTGPLKSPEWKHANFTTPGDRQREILLAPPRARVIDEAE